MATREENIKKINDELEKLSDEELDNVAGGTRLETYSDGNELYKRGLLTVEQSFHPAQIRDTFQKMGYGVYKDYGGWIHENFYTDKRGNIISREQFWKNFDAENRTKIIR